ncbi:MFS transporter [Salinibacterium soli]|uniref:MFS transporter n=1 Tax=Antiquaquibacter soli TaxID=3064523 RepID=A0ABT9BRP4_9MICO|nr:MFS transporter [Protaetiibacter sp. WY-16]MDO7883682.1 MFS transporter [Protaetiibacter sp. WY-16]
MSSTTGSRASSAPTPPFPWVGLVTLSLLVFTSVTSEFLPTGLLPDMARELGVSESQVGILVTVFAGTVVVTAAPLATLTRRFSRKYLILAVLGIFIVGNVLAAVAPNYEVLLVARVIGGLAHGLFWSVVGAYSGHLVPRHQVGRAVAIVSGGGTAAFVLGVPVGTALGHLLGWRVAFAIIAGITLLLTLVTLKFLPPVRHIAPLATGEIALPLRKDKSIPGVVLLCILIVMIITGHNIFYTYIAPFLIGPVGLDEGAVAGVLFLYGGAGAIGVLLAGLLVDRYPRAALAASLVGIMATVLTVGLVPHNPWVAVPAIVAWSIAFGGIPSMVQTRMLHTASARLRDVASAYQTTAFNIGIGGGALIGGIILDYWSITALPFVDIAITASALVLLFVGDRWLHSRARRITPTEPVPTVG